MTICHSSIEQNYFSIFKNSLLLTVDNSFLIDTFSRISTNLMSLLVSNSVITKWQKADAPDFG